MSYDILLLNYDWSTNMNANDYMDMESARSQAIQQLAEVCAAMGLSWTATEKIFTIDLPNIIVAKAANTVTIPLRPTTRRTFDISTWGEPGPVEGEQNPLPDDFQMPDYGQILEEGVPPEGDPNAEK